MSDTNAPVGATLLDEKDPGWHRHIDLGRLDIGSPKDCVLGQRFLSYHAGLKALGLQFGRTHGFSGPVSPLNRAWDVEIRLRLLEDAIVAKQEAELALA